MPLPAFERAPSTWAFLDLHPAPLAARPSLTSPDLSISFARSASGSFRPAQEICQPSLSSFQLPPTTRLAPFSPHPPYTSPCPAMSSLAEAVKDKKQYFPLAGGATDGFSNADTASATCFCGAVQLEFVSSLSSIPQPSGHLRPSAPPPHLPFSRFPSDFLSPISRLLLLVDLCFALSFARSPDPPLPRPGRYLPLPLHRLPQGHCQHHRNAQLYRPLRPTSSQAPPRRR